MMMGFASEPLLGLGSRLGSLGVKKAREPLGKAVPGNPPQACKDPDYKELIEDVGGWCALPMG